VFSEQKSQTKRVVAEGGGTIQDFEMFALDYDNDRNFFYRNILETSMMRPKNYPLLIVEFKLQD
jgi:cell surface protein SprA